MSSRQRPSPSEPAKFFMGKDKIGNDGRTYTSTPDKNGVYRWKLKKHSSGIKNIPIESVLKKATKLELLNRLNSEEFRYFVDTHLYKNANLIIIQFQKDIYIIRNLEGPLSHFDIDENNLTEVLSNRDIVVGKTKYLEKYTAVAFFKISKDTYLYVDFDGKGQVYTFRTNKQVKRLYIEIFRTYFRSFIQLEGEDFVREVGNIEKKGEFIGNVGIDENGIIYNIDFPTIEYDVLVFGKDK